MKNTPNNTILLTLLCIFIVFLNQTLSASINEEKVVQNLFAKGVMIDLRTPIYSNGVLSTEEGGIITAPDLRIQAKKIIYTRKVEEGEPLFTVSAEGDLIVELGEYLFVGERLTYDFQTKTGVIYEGRTAVEPWFFGAKEVSILPDGSYVLKDGFFTTSENIDREWELSTEEAFLTENRFLEAHDVRFQYEHHPLLWIPSLKADLDWIFDNPISYTVRWGGSQGLRLGVIYEFLSWRRHKASLRLDYRIKRGLGGGFETEYLSADHKQSLETISYLAQDNSFTDQQMRTRYRFQGIYNHLLLDDTLNIHFIYDKLSDRNMATDYNDNTIILRTAGRTELNVRQQEEDWISNLSVRVRVNGFQTVKQELPTFQTSWRPISIGDTGIIVDNLINYSYLDFKYADHLSHVHDYESSRVEISNKFYCPITLDPLIITPEVGDLAIFYGNSPDGDAKYLLVGMVKCDVRAHGYRFYGDRKHVVEPYANYEYYIYPTIPPNHHYIFDTDDGWYRLNALRFGVSQSLYGKNSYGCLMRYVYADVYAYSFFNTKTMPKSIPEVYARIICNTFPTLRHTLETAWDIRNSQLGHFNFRSEWTVSQDIALSVEYRHRDAFDWRKVDHNNFFLESFHSQRELRHTSLSDRRDTLLLRMFCRILPNWAIDFGSRQGWDRMFEPNYTEFEFDVLGTLRSACNLRLSYQHREHDDRIAVYFTLGLNRPVGARQGCVPCLEF